MQLLMRFLNTILTVYSLLLMIRILLTWFPGFTMGRPAEFLSRLTDPYLNLFRGLKFLRFNRFDFSPVAAFIVLGLLMQITAQGAASGRITLGGILAYILLSVWSLAQFLLFVFLAAAALRLIFLLFHLASYHPFTVFLDRMLAPLLETLRKLFFRRSFVTPVVQQIILLLFLGVIYGLGVILVSLLRFLLLRLPF
ncbi:MAG: YggT family protein [Spirochaetales bacterium]|jgi:YggT family protein|nr:YggT family protein [Spirochaetales bacterium]